MMIKLLDISRLIRYHIVEIAAVWVDIRGFSGV